MVLSITLGKFFFILCKKSSIEERLVVIENCGYNGSKTT